MFSSVLLLSFDYESTQIRNTHFFMHVDNMSLLILYFGYMPPILYVTCHL